VANPANHAQKPRFTLHIRLYWPLFLRYTEHVGSLTMLSKVCPARAHVSQGVLM